MATNTAKRLAAGPPEGQAGLTRTSLPQETLVRCLGLLTAKER